jgi:glycosyltransferase involved in cell wall biosynthesis
VAKTYSVLIIGPFPNPLTGVSIANRTLQACLQNRVSRVYAIDMELNRGLDESIGKIKWYKLKGVLIYLQLWKVIKCDTVYCTVGQSFMGILKYAPFVILAKLLKKRAVAHLHGNALRTNYERFSSFRKSIVQTVLSKFDKAIVISKSMRGNFTPFLDDIDIHTIDNFVSPELTNNPASKDTRNSLNVLFLSNLLPAKGIIEFLDCAAGFSSTSGIQFKVAGAIPDELNDLEARMSAIDNLTYHGIVENSEKSALYEWAHIFCLPTLNQNEGQPLAILEALHFGCVVIASNVPGISDILNSKNGILLDHISGKSIEKAIKKLDGDRTEMQDMSRVNRAYSHNFTLEAYCSGILKILQP